MHEPDGEKFTNRFTFKYDENGLLVEFVRYGDSGEVEARGRPKYDKNGNKVEDVMYDVNGNIWSKFVYKYDKKGNKVECLDFQPGVGFAAQKFTYKYDSKGNMVEQIMYTNAMKEKVRQKHAYKYDGNGHKVGESTVNFTYASDSWADGKDSKTFHKSIYEYDEKGNIIKEINESVELHSIYKYDGNGKCLEIEQRNSAGKVIGKNIFKYDGKGNKVKETWHEPRTVNGETRFVPILGTSWEFTYWN